MNNDEKEAVKNDFFAHIKPPQWKLDLIEKRRKSESVKTQKINHEPIESDNKPPWLNELKRSMLLRVKN